MRKLIRDNYKKLINEDQLDNVLPDSQEYFDLLLEKLHEELTELKQADYRDVTEYADVIEVLLSIGKFHNLSFPDILEATLAKRTDKGSFNDGLVLDKKHGR